MFDWIVTNMSPRVRGPEVVSGSGTYLMGCVSVSNDTMCSHLRLSRIFRQYRVQFLVKLIEAIVHSEFQTRRPGFVSRRKIEIAEKED